MEFLLALDQQLFHFIHEFVRGPLIEIIARILSGDGAFVSVWFAVIAFIQYKKFLTVTYWKLVVSAAILGTIISELILKNIFMRPRPLPTPDLSLGVWVRDPACCGYSFPSNHATVAFAIAYILSKYFPIYRWGWYFLALLVAWSRIYLGRHYPSDILVGALIGTGIGVFVVYINALISNRKLLPRSGRRQNR